MHTNEKNFPMFSIGYKEIFLNDRKRLEERSRARLHSPVRYYYALVVSMLAVTFQRCAPQSTTTVLGLTLMT